MDGTFVKELSDIMERNQLITEPKSGLQYAPASFKPILPHDPRPDTIMVGSLYSLIDYLKADIEKLPMAELMILVQNPEQVSLLSAYSGINAKRTRFMEARLDEELPVFPFDHYLDPEDFLIKARSMILPTEDLETIIAIISKLTVQNEVVNADDGLSQQISVKRGISGGLTEKESTKGKYTLSPYRTFREVKQPESEFILRFKAVEGSLPKVALFSAAGGMWRSQAMQEIQRFISTELEHLEIDIPVFA